MKTTLLDKIILEFLADVDPNLPPAEGTDIVENEKELASVLMALHRIRSQVHKVIQDSPKICGPEEKQLVGAYDTVYFGIAGTIIKG